MKADEGRLREWLSDKVSAALPGNAGKPDENRPLTELGLSSARLVGLLGELGDLVGADIPVTLVWERPTIAALAAAVAGGGDNSTRPGRASAGAAVTPVAVIGLGCRLPGGVEGPAAFWEFLEAGRDGVTELPAGRWADFVDGGGDASLTADLPRRGGFLADVDGFDAEYFGIAPREAALMDPQQRLFLEVATAAVRHAGITVDSLRGSRTGVFAGVSASEYTQLTVADLAGVEAWTGTGAAISVIANRLSYLWDLRGPSMTIDTACSSSLVAVHQACRALRDGEIDTAIVGGVNLLLGPAITASFHAAGALSADGRCKAFDASADGIVRGEGCGVVVLRRLPEARRAGSRVLAVIRSSAVNSDGRSNGLMAPNPAAQEELLRDAYAAASLEPSTVDYIEAHGTGTLLGDPIEAGALGSVLGKPRSDGRPLLLGSVKTNLGHLEGAAGIAGLIKVVLSMVHRRLPASLHYHRPNPHIRFDAHRLEVVAEPRNWPRYSGVATAGVSSFGFGGTNAHVVLEEFPQAVPAIAAPAEERARILALSGATLDRVRQSAGALAGWLSSAGAASRLDDVAHTLSRQREPGRALAAVVGRDHAELVDALHALARGDREGVFAGEAADRPGPVWVFSGFGSQWTGMARRMLSTEPAFASMVDDLDPLFLAKAGFSLRSAIVDGDFAGVRRTQLVLYGVQLGLAALWQASGVTPGAVIGHSMGEVTAAVAAGALDAATGLDVMVARAGLLEGTALDNAGAMAVVELSEAEHAELATRYPDVEIAVHFSPTQCTVAGPRAQVLALVEEVAGRAKLARLLDVGGAGHSATVDPLIEPLRAALSTIEAGVPEVPFYSTVLDDPRATPKFDAGYWADNLRRAVRFRQAVSAATADGFRVFVEISPHPIAAIGITDSARHAGGEDAVIVSTLRRDTDDDRTFHTNLAALYAAGLTGIDEARRPRGQLVELPPPVWRRRRHWVAPAARRAGTGTHPLLGAYVPAPEGNRHLWHADVGTGALPWLADHSVHGIAVLPGTAYLEMAVAAAAQALDVAPNRVAVRDLVFERVLPLEERTPVTVSLTRDSGETRVEVFGRSVSREWVRHASATVEIRGSGVTEPRPVADAGDLQDIDVYQEFRTIGQEYGPAFRGVTTAAARDGRAFGQVVLPEQARAGGGRAFALHPALTDACLHLLAAAVASAGSGTTRPAGLHLPVGIDAVRIFSTLPAAVRCVATVDSTHGDTVAGSVDVLDEGGRTLVQLSGVRVRGIDAAEVPTPLADKMFERRWEKNDPARGHGAPRQGSWLVVTDFAVEQPWVDHLVRRLGAAGHRVSEVHRPDAGTLLDAVSELDDPEWPLRGILVPAAIRPPKDQHDGDDLATAERLVFRTADVIRTLAARPGDTHRVWTLTRGAAAVADGERGDPTSACLRGLVRVLGYEHPLARATTVDLDPDPSLDQDRLAESAVDELLLDVPDDEVALRGGTRYTARAGRTALRPVRESTRPVVRPGSYVITGGLGGLGLLVADWLAARGAARVVLAGRSAPGEQARAELDRMRAAGTEIVVVNCDIGAPGAAESLVRAATADGVAMHGLVHAAGLLADAAVTDLDPADLHRVWWPKVWGGLRLHEATRHLDLDWWVVFSSAASLFGSPGQASYATANAWLDALVGWRRSAGLPATTINWGAWSEVGGARDTTNPLLRPITPAEGLAALEAALDAERGDLAVTGLDIATVLELFPELRRRPFFAALTSEASEASAAGDDAWPGVEGLANLDPVTARELVGSQLVARLAAIMGFSVETIPRNEPLTGLGLDSLMAMRARNAVEGDFGQSLPIPLLLRGATVRDLERHLVVELGLAAAGDVAAGIAGETEPGGLAPRDATERWIARVWREITGRPTPAVREHLLDLDRDRQLAERVAGNLGDTLGIEVKSEELFAEPTLERLADQLRERFESDGGGVLRRLRPGGSRNPLFLFHPAGGPTSVYQPLVDRLTADLPCYGFERIDDVQLLEDKAERYVRMIREIQPAGPYHLAGWSFGGILGFECAQQLTASGEEVALLAMIDTILPKRSDDGSDQNGGGDLILRYRRFVDHIEQAYGTQLDVPWDKLALLDEDEQFDLVMELISKPEIGIGAAVLRHQYTSYVDARVGERYRPRSYDGPAVLYRARDGHRLTTSLDPRYDRSDEALGWDEYCGGIEVVYVPGDHVSMIDPPHIHVVADHIAGLLGDS